MKRLCLFFIIFSLINDELSSNPIETPELDERNKFVIQAPPEWAYRTFQGENGLIGVLWPFRTSFNLSDTVIFVFLQNTDSQLPNNPENINLFTEKCPKANFKFAKSKDLNDPTKSIEETYFSGRCGRTMVLFEERVRPYNVIISLISSKYISKQQLADVKEIVSSYKAEIEKYIKNNETEESSEKPPEEQNDT
ncbi:MAG: hypothetical protein LBS23_01190 [Holosporaceae bacterium]|jgi:hypothetical protein|nr:hypothetical protein [Holosporaceae bacterium]